MTLQSSQSTRRLQFLLFSILTTLRGRGNKKPMANKKQNVILGGKDWGESEPPDMSTLIPFPYFWAANFGCPSDFHAYKGWPENGEFKKSFWGGGSLGSSWLFSQNLALNSWQSSSLSSQGLSHLTWCNASAEVSWSLCFSPWICVSVDVKHLGAVSALLDTEFRDILPGDVYSSFIFVVKDAISTERYYPDFFKALLLFISEKFL